MRICPNDSSHNSAIGRYDTFCWRCGAQIVDNTVKCESCGNEVSPNDHFCTQCGRPLK